MNSIRWGWVPALFPELQAGISSIIWSISACILCKGQNFYLKNLSILFEVFTVSTWNFCTQKNQWSSFHYEELGKRERKGGGVERGRKHGKDHSSSVWRDRSPLEGDRYLWSLVFRWGRGQVVNEHLPRHRSGLGTLEKAALLSLHSLSFLTSKSLLRPRRKGTASGRDTSGINFISKKTWLSIFGKKTLKAIDFLSLLF